MENSQWEEKRITLRTPPSDSQTLQYAVNHIITSPPSLTVLLGKRKSDIIAVVTRNTITTSGLLSPKEV